MASSSSLALKRTGLLTYPGSSSLCTIPSKETLAQFPIVRDNLCEVIDKLPLSAHPQFKDTEEDENHNYLILFDDHPYGEEVLITPHSIMRLSSLTDIRFESITQSNQAFDLLCEKVLAFRGVSKKVNEAGAKKAVTIASLRSLTR